MKRETLLIFAIALATLVSCTPLLENVDGNDEVDEMIVKDEPLEPGVRSWKECAWNMIDVEKNNGLIKECLFRKVSKASYLYVKVLTHLSINACEKCCKRWYVTFDGEECRPVPIDGIVYTYLRHYGGDTSRPQMISGHCKINKAGTVKVALHVGHCKGYENVRANAWTGLYSATRIYLEEMQPPQ